MCLVQDERKEETPDLGMVEVSLDEVFSLRELKAPLKCRLISLKCTIILLSRIVIIKFRTEHLVKLELCSTEYQSVD